MCLIAFAWQAHADYPLVVVGNRDEFYNRPAQSAHFWEEQPQIFGGRDLSAGGTWMAVALNGRFAAVTNYRDPQNLNPQAKSRGALVSDFLLGDFTATDYANHILARANDFNGFNLLVCDGQSMAYCSNQLTQMRLLEPGVYALSNALLDTPWPKTIAAREQLRQWLDSPGSTKSLLSLLGDTCQAEDQKLPKTGIPYAMEKALSAQFIQLEHYGTRCTTAFTVTSSGQAEFIERTFQPDTKLTQHSFVDFWCNY